MNLVTYNLRSGGTGRSHWAKILEGFRPEIFFVQETVAPQEHLPPMFHPEMAGRYAWKRAEGRHWGSAVYAGRGEIRPIELPDFHGHVVGLEITGAEWPGGSHPPLRAFSVHAPARGGYQRAVNQILDMIARHAGGGDLVIGGDFNLTITARQATEGRRTSAADLAIQRRLRDEFRLVNCWQEANPGRPPAQTLRWSNAPEVPYHCDGLFVPRSWAGRLRGCEVISSPDWDRLSDHNPVVSRFGLRGVATEVRSASGRKFGENAADTHAC
jgi:endonuclease/exonuclease/phosphatase family metal-dependent hydrolase